MFEILAEIFDTLSKNKLRTALTGFAVAWGIFIFIVLLGMGTGLENAMEHNFGAEAKNKITVSGGRTSKEYDGMPKGRELEVYNEDAIDIDKHFERVNGYSTVYWFGSMPFNYKDKSGTYRTNGIGVKGQNKAQMTLLQGRFLNELDIKYKRKVVLLGKQVYEELFGKDEVAVGKYVQIHGSMFQVIGVISYNNQWKNSRVFFPITTAQSMYNSGSTRVHDIDLNVNASLSISKHLETQLRNYFARKYNFDPTDRRAVYIENNIEEYGRAKSVIVGVKMFVGIIGILTLISGITGISNIMLISVKERTREIGIRKALGARPSGIIKLVILESIIITGIAGYFGLVLGVGVVEAINSLVGSSEAFRNPSVNLSTAVAATILMVVAGAIAGWLPARRAAKIKPIEALRYE